MKTMREIIQPYILFLLFLLSENTFSQGSGNHITMYLQNCSQTSPTSLQFDLYAVSDGAVSSDLSANAFQYGVNFNTAILNGGAATAKYVFGTSDIPSL